MSTPQRIKRILSVGSALSPSAQGRRAQSERFGAPIDGSRRSGSRVRLKRGHVEALTLVSETRVPDDVYERVREQFSEDELVHLSLAIVAINGWNRLNIAERTVPGEYVAGSVAKLHTAR